MDFIPLKDLVEDLLSGDRAKTRAAVDHHVAPDVTFSHILGTARGREAFYGIYRAAGTAWRYKIAWQDYLRCGSTVVLQLDLGIRFPPFYMLRYHFPTVIILRFKEGPDGRPLLAEQVDHHSALAVLWLLGWPFTAISEAFLRPTSGFIISRTGWALDAAMDARAAAWGLVSSGVLAALRLLEPAGAALEGAAVCNSRGGGADGLPAVRKSL
ncbi:MAG: hypothetical protein J3K34DRAFT_146241 [Monoraphidium minutum]|nr:MAG: hypothetical protein J3K34DRAFT_146241 [Monoraphidium minutum]